MSETFRTTPPDQQWSGTNSAGNGYQGAFGSEPNAEGDNEVGKALLIGLLGGLASAAGYMVYRRLPDDQKERLHSQVRTLVAQRITELRQNFNI
ncbi:MAG TPA: hypothetical protein VMV65_00160 [Alphaproteobacteria bacterium]|nr:hypothetical protein [Alphaproteobacteria bacterium]